MAKADRRNLLLVDYLCAELRKIIDAQLTPGDRLPPVRKLCSKYRASPSSMMSAIKQLEREGLVIRQHGRGVFVSDLKAPLVGVINKHFESFLDPKQFQRQLSMMSQQYGFRMKMYDAFPSHLDAVRDQVRGIVCLYPPQKEEWLRNITRHGIVILSDSTSFVPGVITIGKNGFHAGVMAAEHLIEAGHTRIGYIGMNPYYRSEGRYGVEFDSEIYPIGITEALLRHNIKPDPRLSERMRHYPPDEKRPMGRGTEQIFKTFFSLREPPTALIVHDQASVGCFVLKRLEKMGRKVPDDVSVVTFGHLEDPTTLTIVGSSISEFIEHAFRRLHLTLQSGRAETSEHLWLDVKLDDRGSVKKVK